MRRVSVIVPTYNRPLMLREALASIRALDAEYDDVEFEIIVGDNGLTDETRQSCEAYGGVYAPAPGKGASFARNAAMRLATGEFIAFLDDDDVWLSGHIRPHLAHLDANPPCDAVFGQVLYTDYDLKRPSDPWPENPGEGDTLTRTMLSGMFPQIGTVVARRAVIDQIGFFDTRLIGGQDLDWLLRLATRRKLSFLPKPCILFRSRPPGSSDALQRIRIGFDRRVFLRHSLPHAHRLWKSPRDFIRAYHATLLHYYGYFSQKAIWFAEHGSLREVTEALAPSVLYLPLLLASDLLRPSPLRKALVSRILHRRHAANNSPA